VPMEIIRAERFEAIGEETEPARARRNGNPASRTCASRELASVRDHGAVLVVRGTVPTGRGLQSRTAMRIAAATRGIAVRGPSA
jgi:galactokinase